MKVKSGSALLNAALVGMPGMPSAAEAVVPSYSACNIVAAARVSGAEIIEQVGGKCVCLVKTACCPSHIGQSVNTAGSDDRTRDEAAAVGQRSNRLLHFVVIGVASKCAVPRLVGAVDAQVELALMICVVRGARVIVGRRRSD